jgi:hypothetical protein
MTTTILQAIKTFIATYTGLEALAPLSVDYIGSEPPYYAIVPLAGSKIVENYIDGGSKREFPFALQSMEMTADEGERLENAGFYEGFSDWLESQTNAGILPTLNANQTAEEIVTLGQPYLFQQGESSTGIYQIQCKLTYRQAA